MSFFISLKKTVAIVCFVEKKTQKLTFLKKNLMSFSVIYATDTTVC